VARLELRAFSDEVLAEAGALLADRHRRHREAEPALPRAYEDPAAALEAVEGAWRKAGAAGVVAVSGGRVMGYLIGAAEDEAHWGVNHWIEVAGHAVEEPELVRDLYGHAAQAAFDDGRSRHYALVPGNDAELVDAWFRVGLGQQQAYGIKEVEPTVWPDGVRPAEPGDVEALVELAPAISRQHAASPVFSDHAARRLDTAADEALRAEIEADVARDDIGMLLVERDGRVVGLFELTPIELAGDGVGGHGTLARPEGACYLAFAATDPEARGSGWGLRLTQAAFAWAHDAGYGTMVTDWRVTNLLASRFWPRRGFRTTFLRLYRSIP
jgi:ribosomal protein S18 acetylase RimI-like enzyme